MSIILILDILQFAHNHSFCATHQIHQFTLIYRSYTNTISVPWHKTKSFSHQNLVYAVLHSTSNLLKPVSLQIFHSIPITGRKSHDLPEKGRPRVIIFFFLSILVLFILSSFVSSIYPCVPLDFFIIGSVICKALNK